ncbi:MAG TPA: DUF4226 domain-containing protein [Mycobacterium sp.]|nr:DUF4226 domain-containing protein [Mycobacterium sp.]
MTTVEDVIAAIQRIERAGRGGPATVDALLDVGVPLQPSWVLDGVLDRLRSAYPEFFPRRREPNTPPGPTPPQPRQQGVAAEAMEKAETELAQVKSKTAEFDRQVIEALRQAHQTTVEGRRRLDELAAEIDEGTRLWDLSTAAGAREFQRFLLGKLRRIIAVVQDGNDDDASKEALASAWAALYAAQADPDRTATAADEARPGESAPTGRNADRKSEPLPDSGADQDFADQDFADPFYGDPVAGGPEPGERRTPVAAAPPLGDGVPGGPALPFGGLPFGGMPGGLPGGLPTAAAPAGLPPHDPVTDGVDDEPPTDEGWLPADQSGEADADGEPAAPEPAAATGPVTVTLPNGETVTAATPQLAAVLQAAADGTPVADAFRQQGIIIPPPGTAVAAPVDQSQVGSGDIGMFTDRHALALGDGKALLDGQIQRIANVRGPSFLGWQHPPMVAGTTEPTRTPTATRPAAAVTAWA